MAMGRISVPLSTVERQALVTMAERGCRDPRDHLRFMLRTEAQRLGLIEDDGTDVQKKAVYGSDKQTRDDQDQARTP